MKRKAGRASGLLGAKIQRRRDKIEREEGVE